MRRGARAAAAFLVWAMAGLGRECDRPRGTLRCMAWTHLAASGPLAWRAAAAWGTGSRWLGAAPGELQEHADGCGAAALGAVLRNRGIPAPQALLWARCRTARRGTTLGRLAQVARSYGADGDLWWCRDVARLPVPAIVHLRARHFVVLLGRDATRATILDPACGRVLVPFEALARRASGVALVFGTRHAFPGSLAAEDDP